MGRIYATDVHGRVTRAFTIYPDGRRAQPVRAQIQSTMSADAKARKSSKIIANTQALVNAGTSDYSTVMRNSAMRKWNEFCEIFELDPTEFGKSPHKSHECSMALITYEGEVLSQFAAFSFHSSTRRKSATVRRQTVMRDIACVREYYNEINSRSPGVLPNGKSPMQLYRALRGIAKLENVPENTSRPIMQQHMRKVKRTLDLENSPYHRVLWAHWLCMWQGMLRSGDLIRSQNPQDPHAPWDPDWDSHRDRIKVEMIRDNAGKELGYGIVLSVKQQALSAGAALLHMLRNDDVKGDQRLIPLFRNPGTGKELTYAQSKENFVSALKAANLPELATGLHGLRKGGATAMATAEGGGEALAIAHGGWKSSTYRKYLFEARGQVAKVTAQFAMQEKANINSKAGPLFGK